MGEFYQPLRIVACLDIHVSTHMTVLTPLSLTDQKKGTAICIQQNSRMRVLLFMSDIDHDQRVKLLAVFIFLVL